LLLLLLEDLLFSLFFTVMSATMQRLLYIVLPFLLLLWVSDVFGWVVPSIQKARRYGPLFSKTTMDGEEIRGPITPLSNFVLVKLKDTLKATQGGILLPDQAKERPTEGVVLAAGPGKLHPHTGIRIKNPVQEGYNVLYGKLDGIPIQYNDDQCQMVRDDDIMLYYDGVTMTVENVTPVRDYVLVELEQDDLQTKSGIVVAAAAKKEENPCEGVVVKVGEGRLASLGDFTPSPVRVGDVVKFKDYAGNEVSIEGKPYALVRMVDILCSLNPEIREKEKAPAGAP
jgi:chaperonin GroES